jgi:NAD(P)H-hydrate epimerase
MPTPLTRDQVRRVDRIAMTEYGMSGLVLMENAGRGAAEIINDQYGPKASALVVCGTGNNGGDGFVIARHLHNRGWRVRLVVTGATQKLTPDARANAHVTDQIGLATTIVDTDITIGLLASAVRSDDVIVDAILGTGFEGDVREPMASLIAMLNESTKRAMIAIDVPSGLDCDTGVPGGVSIVADHTVTFVAMKVGFDAARAEEHVGTVHVVDIGCPKEAIKQARQGI